MPTFLLRVQNILSYSVRCISIHDTDVPAQCSTSTLPCFQDCQCLSLRYFKPCSTANKRARRWRFSVDKILKFLGRGAAPPQTLPPLGRGLSLPTSYPIVVFGHSMRRLRRQLCNSCLGRNLFLWLYGPFAGTTLYRTPSSPNAPASWRVSSAGFAGDAWRSSDMSAGFLKPLQLTSL